MKVSICIPTRNRPDDLAECLKSVAASSIEVSEVVVSDDSTDARTHDLVAAEYPYVKYVSGPRKGLGPNRNAAIEAASADWIVFLDDDARLGPEFLATLAPIVLAERGTPTIYSGIEKQVTGFVYPNDQDFLGFQSRPYGARREVNTLVINATLFPTALLKRLMFDPRLIYGYDEVDIAARARAAGYRIVLVPDAVNLHFPSPVNRDYYSAHTDAARIYVTYKRYADSDRRTMKALGFLIVSFLHSLLHHLNRSGIKGLGVATRLHATAWKNIGLWRRERNQPHLRSPRIIGSIPGLQE